MNKSFATVQRIFIVLAAIAAVDCKSDKAAVPASSSPTAGAGGTSASAAGSNSTVAVSSDSVAGDESASELALSSLSGAIAEDEGLNLDLALRASPAPDSRFASWAVFGISKALAAPKACPVLSNDTLANCKSGKLTLALDTCQYERPNMTFAKAVWTGSRILDFGSTCPNRLATIATLTRTVGADTTRTGADGTVLTIDTTAPSGYDTHVTPQPSGGTTSSHAATSRSLDIKGIHYVVEKSATNTKKLWDHTVSTPDPITVAIASGKRTVSGTVLLQHNLAKYTARAEFENVVFDIAQCGCLPISGTIRTTLSGSVSGTETLTISGCAKASLDSPVSEGDAGASSSGSSEGDAGGESSGDAGLGAAPSGHKAVALRHCL